MRLKWDFKEWVNFGDKISDIDEFNRFAKDGCQAIAKVLHQMLISNTPVDYGVLQAGWQTSENYAYEVKTTPWGYQITLYNRTEYATWVNDGHKQRPGRFIPGYWIGNHFRYDPNATEGMVLKKPWVHGRFFVEKSIIQLENSTKIESILYKELTKWFRRCMKS
jgi:hypothetical protein